MAKKPAYPTKTCPGCGKLIHARSQSHDACGWAMNGAAKTSAAPANKAKAGDITVEDVAAVKKLVDQIGAEKVRDLAGVLE